MPVTGPGARIPRDVDPHPSVASLQERGLWDMEGVDARVTQLLESVVQDRMDAFPLHSDEHMPMCGIDLSAELPPGQALAGKTIPYGGDSSDAGSTFAAVGMTFSTVAYGTDVRRTVVSNFADQVMGFHPATPSALLLGLHHEAFHPVVLALQSLPGFVPWLEDQIALVDGRGPFSFADPTHRPRIAAQLGAYAAQLGEPGASPEEVLDEMGAEALAVARHLGPAAPAMARVWWEGATALLGRGSPVARDLNQVLRDLHRAKWFQVRTSPQAVGNLTCYPPEALAAMTRDADFAWEVEHPDAIEDEVADRWEAVQRRARSGELSEVVGSTLQRTSELLRAMRITTGSAARPTRRHRSPPPKGEP